MALRRTSTLILLFVCLSMEVLAQDSLVQQKYPRFTGKYLLSGFTDTWELAASPLHWKPRQWLGFGLVAGSGILLFTQDQAISNYARNHRDPFLDEIATYGLEPIGSGLYSLPLLGGLYLGGRWSGDDRLSSTALTAGKAAAITGAIVHLTKQLSHRHRPFQDDPANAALWDGPFSDWHYTSFPSGHSAMAFSIATVLASEYHETGWVPVVSYTLATATAFSRVYQDRHWASDILLGSLLGYAAGRFIWKLNRHIVVSPLIGKNESGLRAVVIIQ